MPDTVMKGDLWERYLLKISIFFVSSSDSAGHLKVHNLICQNINIVLKIQVLM